MAEQNPQVPQKPKAPRQVLFLCRDHQYEIKLNDGQFEDRDVSINGRVVKERMEINKPRYVRASNHKFYVEEGRDLEKVRNAPRNGEDFIEVLPHPTRNKHLPCLWEMKTEAPTSFDAWLHAIEHRGRKRLTVTGLLEELTDMAMEAGIYKTRARRNQEAMA